MVEKTYKKLRKAKQEQKQRLGHVINIPTMQLFISIPRISHLKCLYAYIFFVVKKCLLILK